MAITKPATKMRPPTPKPEPDLFAIAEEETDRVFRALLGNWERVDQFFSDTEDGLDAIVEPYGDGNLFEEQDAATEAFEKTLTGARRLLYDRMVQASSVLNHWQQEKAYLRGLMIGRRLAALLPTQRKDRRAA